MSQNINNNIFGNNMPPIGPPARLVRQNTVPWVCRYCRQNFQDHYSVRTRDVCINCIDFKAGKLQRFYRRYF